MPHKPLSVTCLFAIASVHPFAEAHADTELISAATDTIGGDSAITPDGNTVVFAALPPGVHRQIFVRDRAAGTTTQITYGNNTSDRPTIDASGSLIAFGSFSSDIVPGDTNGEWDCFLYDMSTGITTRISVATDGSEGNGYSGDCWISGNGTVVAFTSAASNLVADDPNGTIQDVFIYEVSTGQLERLSPISGYTLASQWPSLSADGRLVAFASFHPFDPLDNNGRRDIYLYDRLLDTVELVSATPAGAAGNGLSSHGSQVSGDGSIVVFGSDSSDLVPGDTNGVRDTFVYDRATGIVERVSVSTAGSEANGASSFRVSATFDGRFLAFDSEATNLAPEDDTPAADVYVRDRMLGTTTVVSLSRNGRPGNGISQLSVHGTSISDGGAVTFQSTSSNLTKEDKHDDWDTFVFQPQ